MKPLHKKNKHKDKHSYLEVIIHFVNITEPGWNDIKPEHYPNYQNIIDITFAVRDGCMKAIEEHYNAKYLCSFDASVLEDEFKPFLLKCLCHAYTLINWKNPTNNFKIKYFNTFKEDYSQIIMDREKAKTNAAEVKELYIRVDLLFGSLEAYGLHVKTFPYHPSKSEPSMESLKEPWLLWRGIKNV
jgi:hypothetical protein